MRISIVGSGDVGRITKFSKASEEEVQNIIEGLGKMIAEKGHELVIIPNKGIPVEIAKVYKENNGKKLLGVVPVKDTRYGTKHIEENLDLLDEQIEVDSWYDADGEIAAAGEICIVVGMSAGIMRDISVLKYHYKYLDSKTKIVWFKNTTSAPLHKEIEEVLPVQYVESSEEVEGML